MEKQLNLRMCFACGIENPIGLKLKFYTDGEDRCIAHFHPRPAHQGYPGQVHGGLVSTLLDEPTPIPLSLAFSLYDRVPLDREKSRSVLYGIETGALHQRMMPID